MGRKSRPNCSYWLGTLEERGEWGLKALPGFDPERRGGSSSGPFPCAVGKKGTLVAFETQGGGGGGRNPSAGRVVPQKGKKEGGAHRDLIVQEKALLSGATRIKGGKGKE